MKLTNPIPLLIQDHVEAMRDRVRCCGHACEAGANDRNATAIRDLLVPRWTRLSTEVSSSLTGTSSGDIYRLEEPNDDEL